MSVSDEALATYYQIRSRADQRCAASNGASASPPDALRHEIENLMQDLYRERLGRLEGLAVGEIGPGGGDFVRYAIEQRARSLVVMDISQEWLDALEREFGLTASGIPTKLIAANAQRMAGVDDGELDLLVAKEVIEHLPDYRPFLKECRRVLRPGGRLYLTTPNRHSIDLWPRLVMKRLVPPPKRRGSALIQELFGHLYEYVTPEEERSLAAVLPDGFKEHIHEFAPTELLRSLNEHGFQTIRRWGTTPQMFFHELRPLARRLLPGWNKAERLSYALGDDMRLIAVRT